VRERVAKKAYIQVMGCPSPSIDRALTTARGRGWRAYEMPCGHDAMIDMPERLAEIFEDVA
jgi:hypothetical protein